MITKEIIDQLKTKYPRLRKVIFGDDEYIFRILNKVDYRNFQTTLINEEDHVKAILKYFVVYPELSDKDFEAMAPGIEDNLTSVIMKEHGYTEPIIIDL